MRASTTRGPVFSGALDKLVPKQTLSADLGRLKEAGIHDVRVRFQPGVGHSTDGLMTTELSEYIVRRAGLAISDAARMGTLQKSTGWEQQGISSDVGGHLHKHEL